MSGHLCGTQCDQDPVFDADGTAICPLSGDTLDWVETDYFVFKRGSEFHRCGGECTLPTVHHGGAECW